MNILILNHCSHNKGDNSVLYYLLECMDMISVNNEVTVSCSNGKSPFWIDRQINSVYWPGGKIFKSPEDNIVTNIFSRINFMMMRKIIYRLFLYFYSKENDVLAKLVANVFFGRDLLKAYRNATKVICTGGHHISNVLEKDCINPQLVSLALADLFSHHVVMWSQSVGPIGAEDSYIKNAMRRIFDSCSCIFLRDDLSVSCVAEISNTQITVAPDSVFLSNKLVEPSASEMNQLPYVCCAVYTAGIKDVDYLNKYKNAWIKISKTIKDKGLDVVFVPMQYKSFGGDERPFLNEIVVGVNSPSVRYVEVDDSPKETLTLFKNATFIIGHKTHSVIYGLALEVPTIAIAYHEKTRYFMSLFNFDKYVFDDVIGCEANIVDLISDDVSLAQKNEHSLAQKGKEYAEQLVKNMLIAMTD